MYIYIYRESEICIYMHIYIHIFGSAKVLATIRWPAR